MRTKLNRFIVLFAGLLILVTFFWGQRKVIIDRIGDVYVENNQNDSIEYICKKKDIKVQVQKNDEKSNLTVTKRGTESKYEVTTVGEGSVVSIHVKNLYGNNADKVYTYDKSLHAITNVKKNSQEYIIRMALGDSRWQIVEDLEMYLTATILLVLGVLFVTLRKQLSILDNYIISIVYELKDPKTPNSIVSTLVGSLGIVIIVISIVMYWMQFMV